MSISPLGATALPTYPAAPVAAAATPVAASGGALVSNGMLHDVWAGASERFKEFEQYALHPLDASKRQMPWKDPCPTTAEKVGRWIADGALVVPVLLAGEWLTKGALGGFLGRGAVRVGTR